MSAEHPHGGVAALSSPYARCQHGPQDGGGGEEGGGGGGEGGSVVEHGPIFQADFWADFLV